MLSAQHWMVIAEEPFLPADSGGRVESCNLLAALAAQDVRVTLVVPTSDAPDQALYRGLVVGGDVRFIRRAVGVRSHARLDPFVVTSRPVTGLLATLNDRPMPWTAVVSLSYRACHLGETAARLTGLPHLVRSYNIESDFYRVQGKHAGGVRGRAMRLEAWKLARSERKMHASPYVSCFAEISLEDAVRRKLLSGRPVIALPPFLPPTTFMTRTPGTDRSASSVLFLGSLDTATNISGLSWFVTCCWPRIVQRRPDARLTVVGRRASKSLRALLAEVPAVELMTDVPDVLPYLDSATVMINPSQAGAGINIKMVEALAAGTAVVATGSGARGLDWRPGIHFLRADQPTEFADAVLDLLADPGRRSALAAAGQAFVQQRLAWPNLLEQMYTGLFPYESSSAERSADLPLREQVGGQS